ncbi:DNA-binding protein [Halobacillus seohaensis]|uniref:DNA-binding protein n=1 Tax=Halobacillus seohaensis TaxID=447421 RepID=A0ABW2EKU0_9BACI
MLQAQFDQELFQQMVNDAVDKAIERHALKDQLPPLLTRKQFMELMQIGETKCAELFHREDFPVNREFGHPRVPTTLLMDWIYSHTDWVKKHADPKKLSIV